MASSNFNYPAEVECDEDGRHVVTFPDFGWGATDGATRDEALDEARDLLRELLTATMREGKNLPAPSSIGRRRSPLIVPPIQIALKAALYESFRESAMSRRQFARQLNVAETEVRRMLNPDHATKPAAIERALRHLGKHVRVTTEPVFPSCNFARIDGFSSGEQRT
ncbi:MAG: type II toxin-antitoxin system HicB family antitoxin [Gammaproteobacteria bacterium]|nr:type II toxin-antitoxin system HicB family antitoxin [Gammaproteobacteria bacterium]MYE99458.1 type II toxin-antitoxin system HicB family antitoxin [Gammaproteobacteria bacterium]MYG97606.1 type II toxin-antitoxin system HicB family antitoxin [Gammaproteobacteria bacterium]